MISIEEKKMVLAVGGEDENGNLVDSCEAFSIPENQWKVLNTLNTPGKLMSLCKFNSKFGKEDRLLIYSFNRNNIERINLNMQ